jgi:hypothetical protein
MISANQKRNRKILNEAEMFFKEKIFKKHIQNIQKCETLKEFKVNPFTHKYLAGLVGRRNSKISLAKALILPRCLGTSISTSLGSKFQKFIVKHLRAEGSGDPSLDFDFTDKKDRKRKSCQLKAGPNTLNAPDVKQLHYEFSKIKRRKKGNFGSSNIVAGVAYGTSDELSHNYRKLDALGIPIYVGKEFWYRITGDKRFYEKLIKRFDKASQNLNVKKALNRAIKVLSENI